MVSIRDSKASSGAGAVVDIVEVSKAFGSREVLKGVGLRVEAGESLCLLGVNGAGKSTLLRIIAGLLGWDGGTVRIKGYSVADEPEKTKRLLGVISHQSMTYPNLTVLENLNFFGQLYGIENRKTRIAELVEEVGLAAYRYDRAEILSRGLHQRLAIARALLHDPQVLLADEPFTGLDAQSSSHLRRILAEFTARGRSVIMTTHDTRTGLGCCPRVAVLDGGAVVFEAGRDTLDQGRFADDYLAYVRERA